MRLLDNNTKLNKTYHRLGYSKGKEAQLKFLLKLYSQVIPDETGKIKKGGFNYLQLVAIEMSAA